MVEIKLKIDGMMCGMCESHVNNAVRNAADVKKVSSSHAKGETVVLVEDDVDENVLRNAVEEQGYKVLSICKQPYVRKGLFSFGRKKS